jgi:hypothetical protein
MHTELTADDLRRLMRLRQPLQLAKLRAAEGAPEPVPAWLQALIGTPADPDEVEHSPPAYVPKEGAD